MSDQPRPVTKPPTFHVDGVDYSPEGILALHKELAQFRTELMAAGDIDHAVMLSHGVALLYYLMEWLQADTIVAAQREDD